MHVKSCLQNYQRQNRAVGTFTDTFTSSNSNGCGDDFLIPWFPNRMLCDYCALSSLGDQKSQNSMCLDKTYSNVLLFLAKQAIAVCVNYNYFIHK